MRKFHFVGIDADSAYVAPIEIISDSLEHARKLAMEYKDFGIIDIEYCGSDPFTSEGLTPIELEYLDHDEKCIKEFFNRRRCNHDKKR